MKPTKSNQAFTLVELFVVVLIIGILAAVAIPQYKKAVAKSRATQAFTMLSTAYEHAVVYFMENGTYPSTFDEMGMDVPWPVTSSASLKWSNNGADFETETRSDGVWSLQLYHANSGAFAITMGLVTGEYAGAGFRVDVTDNSRQLVAKKITCAERYSEGISFEKNPGDYCIKIMGGTPNTTVTSVTFRSYNLP